MNLPPFAPLCSPAYDAAMPVRNAYEAGVLLHAIEVETLLPGGEVRLLLHVENTTTAWVPVVRAKLDLTDAMGYPAGSAAGSLARLAPGTREQLRAYGKLARPGLFTTRVEMWAA